MAVITYNNYLKQLLGKCKCILVFETAADFPGLTNGGKGSIAQISVTKEQEIEGTQQFIIPSFSQIECEEHHGLLFATDGQKNITKSRHLLWYSIILAV